MHHDCYLLLIEGIDTNNITCNKSSGRGTYGPIFITVQIVLAANNNYLFIPSLSIPARPVYTVLPT